MTVFQIRDNVQDWVENTAALNALADDVGWDVTWAALNTERGTRVVWTFVLTIPSGLAGQGPITDVFTISSAAPAEQKVRDSVAGVLERMRQFRDIAHARAGTPPAGPGLITGRR